ncbi:MAG TPA: hypothetical protein VJC16_03250 [Candidatus Nanoarchaeia archaeon]|nr:hypothetical protein [Candidatus Nanoarchaeia archaeon]
MKVRFCAGYAVYEAPGDIVFVTPHSGPAFEASTSRDEYSETVASLCWQQLSGKFVVGNVSRKMTWGIDLNRGIPPEQEAIAFYPRFMMDIDADDLFHYRRKYAWAARDAADHQHRLQIYSGFWNEVKTGKIIVLIHRAFSRLKVMPSIMDLTTFDSQGVDRETLQGIVDQVNQKYDSFFSQVEREYKEVIRLEQERIISNVIRRYGTFDLQKIGIEFRTNLLRDIQAIQLHAEQDAVERLEQEFTPQRFLDAADSALARAGKPRITVERAFHGLLATGPRQQLFPTTDKIIIQFEPTSFLSFWYPAIGAELICEIIQEVRKASGR